MSSPSRVDVTIIMPAYNAERYIGAAISSVLEQTYQDWELVVVDDGSRDDTLREVRHLAARDARIQYFTKPNGGQAKARNAALEIAAGSMVAFLDADDLWLPHKLERQVPRLQAGADVVFSDGYIFHNDNVLDTSSPIGTISGSFAGGPMLDLLMIYNRLPLSSALVRRELLAKVGGFDAHLFPRASHCEDYDLWCRLAKAGARFDGMPEKLVRYRRHATSATAEKNRHGTIAEEIIVVERHLRRSSLDAVVLQSRREQLYTNWAIALLEQNRSREALRRMRKLQLYHDRHSLVSVYLDVARWAAGQNARWRAAQYFGLAFFHSPSRVLRQELALLAQVILGRELGAKLYRSYLKRFRPLWFEQCYADAGQAGQR